GGSLPARTRASDDSGVRVRLRLSRSGDHGRPRPLAGRPGFVDPAREHAGEYVRRCRACARGTARTRMAPDPPGQLSVPHAPGRNGLAKAGAGYRGHSHATFREPVLRTRARRKLRSTARSGSRMHGDWRVLVARLGLMCGICGEVRFDGAPVDGGTLSAMRD